MTKNTTRNYQRTPLALAIALAATFGATAAQAVDFHGYVRSGIMESNNGGQNAYLAGKLGRFGNETGGWWSMAFSQDLLKTDDGKSFGVWAQLEGDTPLTGTDDWSYRPYGYDCLLRHSQRLHCCDAGSNRLGG